MSINQDVYGGKKDHLTKILCWLEKEVLSACGDGDAFWITRHYQIEELLPLVISLNNDRWNNWWIIETTDSEIILHNHQESWFITTNGDYEVPSWAQCILRW